MTHLDPKKAAAADDSVTSHSQSGGVTAHTINVNSRDPLFEAQLAELSELDQFIAWKNEFELRETFDLPNILRFNVRLQRAEMIGQRDHDAERFFENGAARITLTKVVIRPSPTGGAHQMEPIPGHIYCINISEKYVNNRRKLAQFADSIMLPSEVIDMVKALDATIERNSELMVEVLDERFRSNRRNIIDHEDPKSSRCGGVNNAYWHKFEVFKPLANEIGAAIRKHLKVT